MVWDPSARITGLGAGEHRGEIQIPGLHLLQPKLLESASLTGSSMSSAFTLRLESLWPHLNFKFESAATVENHERKSCVSTLAAPQNNLESLKEREKKPMPRFQFRAIKSESKNTASAAAAPTASPGSSLEIQKLRPQYRPTESESAF